MSGYRFCRSDDVPLLVRAYNECYGVHFADVAPLTVDAFKLMIRELDVWTSSCMVATEAERPIAVLLAAKREREGENLVLSVGVHPQHQRQSHGRHLLDSLRQKLAILGPRCLRAEVPADWSHARAFVEACGYRRDGEYTDFMLHVRPRLPEAADFLSPVTLDDLHAHDAFDREASRCWERAPSTLLNRRAGIGGLALVSDERVEAHLLYHEPDSPGAREILAVGCANPARREALLGVLIQTYCARGEGVVMMRKVADGELPFELLEGLGFRRGARTLRYVAEAG